VEVLPESLRSKCPKDYFARLAAQGRCVFLFDGLDEISDQGVRDEVSKMVGSLANASATDVTWIVTSRIVGYRGHLNQSGFRTSVVEELSRAQIQSYVSNWYREKCLRSDYPPSELPYQLEQHESRARRLGDTLGVNAGLASLATNPMLLSLITLLHSVQLELPDNRAILYRDCVELLCDRWDLFRGVSGDEKVRLSVGEKMSLVIAIAWYLHYRRTRDIDRPVLVEVIRQHLRGALGVTDATAEGVVLQLEERSGLLITRGTNETGQRIMAFSHLSFQEYLASIALQSMSATDVSEVVRDSLRDSWWRETVLLMLRSSRIRPT